MYIYESEKAIQEFYDAVKSKNTKAIEDSKVIKVIDDIIYNPNNQLNSVLPKGKVLYRAREIDTTKAYEDAECGFNAYFDDNNKFHCSGYNYYESKEAPMTISASGRNNIQGASYLYLSSEEYTACAEIKPNIRGLISLARFEIQNDLKIIDFHDRVANYDNPDFVNEHHVYPHKILSYIFNSYAQIKRNDNTYLVTQYLADYIRKAGIDGIKYWGSVNYGTNYTIFNCHKSNIKFLDSRIIATYGVNYDFVDLNTEEQLEPTKDRANNIIYLKMMLARNIKLAREENKNE